MPSQLRRRRSAVLSNALSATIAAGCRLGATWLPVTAGMLTTKGSIVVTIQRCRTKSVQRSLRLVWSRRPVNRGDERALPIWWQPLLYKIQLAGGLPTQSTESDDDVCQRFLKVFLPALDAAFFRISVN